MTGLTIADAGLADVGALARIMGEWVQETEWMPVLHSLEDDTAFLTALLETHIVRVARTQDGLQGFLARQAGYVTALHVRRGARGRGIGKTFLDEVKATEAEITLWTFQANDRAIAFYLREGFQAVERTDGRGNDEGLPDLLLSWRKVP
ncbi:MAG: GNAT family N-acetyltransferase [Rhodobacteraceae bacterium]|nr:GNAT family N-acetyltransferase [Paracoccaceae bacterium]